VRSRLALLALALVLLASSACRLRTEVTVDVQPDGSGTIGVNVALDADAMSRVPGLEQELRLDDLEATGWTITGPALEADGMTWIRASKPFATPEEAGAVLHEVSGDNGPFREFAVTREQSFARTTFGFDGVVDFTAGLDSFGDDALADALDGQALGEAQAAIEDRLGEALDQVFRFQVIVRLPGSVDSNAPSTLENGAAWEPRLSSDGPVELTATSEVTRTSTLVLTGVAIGCAVLALLVLLSLLFRRRIKGRGRHGATTKA
jgi:hypothetical protein